MKKILLMPGTMNYRKDGEKMIAWWWIPIVFALGSLFGMMIYAVCAYDNIKRNGRRWWEDE